MRRASLWTLAVATLAIAMAAFQAAVSASTQRVRDAAPAAAGLASEGFRRVDSGDYAAARKIFERALALATAAGDRGAEAEALRGLSAACYRLSEFPESKRRALEALALYESASNRVGVANIDNQLGSIAFVGGDLDGARIHFERALATFEALNDAAGRARTMRNLGFVFQVSDDRSVSLRTEALALANTIGDRKLQGLLLHDLGDAAFGRGDYSAAVERLQQASSLLEAVNARRELARVFISLGRLHRAHGRPEAAIEFYERALRIVVALNDPLAAAQTYNALGISLGYLRRFREALAAYRRGLDIARRIGASSLVGYLAANAAAIYRSLGQPRRAAAVLEPIVAGPIDRFAAGNAYEQLAWTYLDLNRPADALAAADRSLAAESIEVERLQDLMHARAVANERLGRIDAATLDAERSLEAVERLRSRLVPRDFMKRGFVDLHQTLFSLAIRLYQARGLHDRAAEAAERARARAFLDLMATRALAEHLTQPTAAPRDRTMASLDSGIPSAASAPAASLADLGRTAHRLQSTIVTYWVGERQIDIWVVTASGLMKSATVRAARSHVASLVRRASDDGRARVRVTSTAAVWRDLYTLLILPVRDALPAARGSLLTIVPHGPLFRVPFAALLAPNGRYLLEDFSVHYAPSGGLLGLTAAAKSTPDAIESMSYVLVSNPEGSGRGEALSPIPGATREVRNIARALPAGAALVLDGSNAGEAAVRDALPRRDVVHVAAHGVLLDDRPLESFLALGSNGTMPERDGRLTAAEVYGLRLSASLVVLSACRSAAGPVSGDGVMGMTRAFLYAGTKSIVASMWDVTDEAAAQVMPAFYRSWRRARDKSIALRVAQLDLLERLRAGGIVAETPAGPRALPEHPFLWAAFVLVGEP